MLALWELVIDVFHPLKNATTYRAGKTALEVTQAEKEPACSSIYDYLSSVDYVPPNMPEPNGRAILVLLEDNDPVIQICIKGRSPQLRQVQRIHRVNIDATYERIREDPGVYMRHWPTKYQMVDILTKGNFSEESFANLLDLLQIRARDEKQSKEKQSKPQTLPVDFSDETEEPVQP